jgi:hypothetical protein
MMLAGREISFFDTYPELLVEQIVFAGEGINWRKYIKGIENEIVTRRQSL